MTELTVTTFGGVTIQLGGQALTSVLPVKLRRLLIYTLLAGTAQTANIWRACYAGIVQERADGNLRMALAGLREHVPVRVEITRDDVRASGRWTQVPSRRNWTH